MNDKKPDILLLGVMDLTESVASAKAVEDGKTQRNTMQLYMQIRPLRVEA